MNPPDQIALPDLMGAMENWGLVTYQEGIPLYEEGVSSLLHKDTVATIIAHELAHQVRGENPLCVTPNKNNTHEIHLDQCTNCSH